MVFYLFCGSIQRQISYRIWAPKEPSVKECKEGQVHDTQIECPVVPVVVKPIRTLIARIDRVIVPKEGKKLLYLIFSNN